MPQVLHDSLTFDQIMAKHPEDGTEVIVVKQGDDYHAYRNSCPHIGVGLDYGDGRCLDGEDTLLCSVHGARFEAATGACFDGPCYGDHLQRVPITISDGKILLA